MALSATPKDGFPFTIECGCKACKIQMVAPPVIVAACHCSDCKMVDHLLAEVAATEAPRNSSAKLHVSSLVAGGTAKAFAAQMDLKFVKIDALESVACMTADGQTVSRQRIAVCSRCHTRLFTQNNLSLLSVNYNLLPESYRTLCETSRAFCHYNFTTDGGHNPAALGMTEPVRKTDFVTGSLYPGHVAKDGPGLAPGALGAAARYICCPFPCCCCVAKGCVKGLDGWWIGAGGTPVDQLRLLEWPEQAAHRPQQAEREAWSRAQQGPSVLDACFPGAASPPGAKKPSPCIITPSATSEGSSYDSDPVEPAEMQRA